MKQDLISGATTQPPSTCTAKKTVRRTSVDLDSDTMAALKEIQEHFDLTTMAQAIRKSARVTREVIQSDATLITLDTDGNQVKTKFL